MHIRTDGQFDVNDVESWHSHLVREGWVVIKGVVPTEEERAQFIDKFYSFLEKLGTGIDRTIPESFHNTNYPGIASVGIFKDWTSGAQHSEFMYMAREAMRPVYLKLYAETARIEGRDISPHMFCSADTIGAFRNHTIDTKYRTKDQPWPHIDQNPFTSEVVCHQALLNILNADETTGGFIAIPRSHRREAHEALRAIGAFNEKVLTRGVKQYLPIDVKAMNKLIARRELKEPALICAPPGSAIVWNSMLIHWNAPAIRETPRQQIVTPMLRIVAYVTWFPYGQETNEQRKRCTDVAEQIVNRGVQTNHWATEIQHMPYPRSRFFKPLQWAGIPITDIQKYSWMYHK